MALRRSNDVFLLTLVDFLVQVIFFATFIFVVHQALIEDPNAKEYNNAQVTRAIQLAGVSDLTELTDELTKLAPVTLRGLNESLGEDVQGEDIERAVEAIEKAGGATELDDAMTRLARLEEGQGKPACIFEMREGKRRPKILATAIGTASTISFTENTPELQDLLSSLGLSYGNVQSLGLSEFRRTFSPVISKFPDCRYTIALRETTNLVNARDAAQQVFYVAVRR